MYSKKNTIENIIVAFIVLLAISIGIVCFNYNLIAVGFIIIISFVIMLLCFVLMRLQQGKLMDEKVLSIRGHLLRRFRCNCECNCRRNVFERYSDGYIVFYENGMTYEYDNVESVDYIDYESITYAEFENNRLSLYIKPSGEILNLVILSDGTLRLKMIMNYLLKHNVVFNDVTF